jgi:hypothetical protein
MTLLTELRVKIGLILITSISIVMLKKRVEIKLYIQYLKLDNPLF